MAGSGLKRGDTQKLRTGAGRPQKSAGRRIDSRRIALLLALALFLFCLAASARPERSFRFAWLTDTHVGSERGADELRSLVADINSLPGLSFVIVSGDVTETGSCGELRLAKEILSGLRLPYHIIPGNHDTKWSESGATCFAGLWGQEHFLFNVHGFRFIGMHQGPVMRMADGHWAPQDVRWLDGVLAGRRSRRHPVVFVTHYPVDESIVNRQLVLDRLKKVSTAVILCGHGHANKALEFEGIPAVMSRASVGAGGTSPGYTLVEVAADLISFSERTGGKTLPAWHTVSLDRVKRRTGGWPPVKPEVESPSPPGTDFSVNNLYPEVKVLWRRETGWTIASPAAVFGDLVLVGDASGRIRALRLTDGSTVWEFRTGGPVYSTPCVASGLVIFGSVDGKVRALDVSTGRQVWSHTVEAAAGRSRAVLSGPRVLNGVVFVGSSGGEFSALDLQSGKPTWTYRDVQGFVETTPLAADGKVVFGAWDGRLYALDAATGVPAWIWRGDRSSPLYSPAACVPVAAHGRVFIVAPDKKLTAFDLGTGREIWRTDRWAVRESLGLSEDGERLYIRTTQGVIAAVAASADWPEPLWETDAGFGYDISPAQLIEKDGTLFYGTKNGLLLALDGRTGEVKWKHRVGEALLNTVTPLSGRRVVVTDLCGRVALISSER